MEINSSEDIKVEDIEEYGHGHINLASLGAVKYPGAFPRRTSRQNLITLYL